MRSKHLLLIVSVALLAACSRPEPVAAPVRAVRTLVVAADSAGGVQEYAGEVRARSESRLGFRVGGKLVSRSVDVGASVKAGQVLAQLDAQDLRLGQDAARAAVQAAQVNVDLVAADYRRYKDLRDQEYISAAELERRDTALKAAQAQLAQAQAQAGVQGNQAAYARLVADAAGVITAVDAEPGMVVAAGAPVVRLARTGPRDIVFSVPEDRVSLIKALQGQADVLSVRLWGDGAELLPARIREIAASADPATRTYLVKADLGNAAVDAVRLGQTATVLVALPRRDVAAKLPMSALKEQGGHTVVWVVDPDSMTVRTQPVRVAGVDGNEVVIADGVAPGQRVVTAGVHVLNPGQKVRYYVDPGAPPLVAATPRSLPLSATQPTPVSVK